MEINGDSTAGMTHSQAVEQIRKGGHRIHLVLKRGNGYVPDYGKEKGTCRHCSWYFSTLLLVLACVEGISLFTSSTMGNFLFTFS